MNRLMITWLAASLLTTTVRAQTSAASGQLAGKITYEGMRRIDPSQMRMAVNGQEVRPGSPGAPDAPEGMPDVISFTQKLVFSGTMAKEERDRQPNMTFRRTAGGEGAGSPGSGDRPARDRRMTPPFEQTTYLDLANRATIEVITMKTDSASQTYRSERPMPNADNWQLSDKTKKIAGYLCHKATATRQPTRPTRDATRTRPDSAASGRGNRPANRPSAETYTVWYTTDLPFTYSPVAGLTPEKGVVLQIESDSESFKATGVSMEAVAEAAVQPPKDAQTISPEEMNQLRRKAMADFRQKMMQNGGVPGMGRN